MFVATLKSAALVCVFAVVALLAGPVGSQEAAGTGDAPAPTPNTWSEPQLETMPAMTVIALSVTGSFEQHHEKIGELMGHVGPTGMAQGAPFGVYYNDPAEVPEAELAWAVAIPVAAEATAEAPFEVHQVPERQVATLTCTGPYETTHPCYAPLFEFVAAQGLQPAGPPEEHWLGDPETTAPAELQAKVVLPVMAQ